MKKEGFLGCIRAIATNGQTQSRLRQVAVKKSETGGDKEHWPSKQPVKSST